MIGRYNMVPHERFLHFSWDSYTALLVTVKTLLLVTLVATSTRRGLGTRARADGYNINYATYRLLSVCCTQVVAHHHRQQNHRVIHLSHSCFVSDLCVSCVFTPVPSPFQNKK